MVVSERPSLDMFLECPCFWGFHHSSVSKESACNAGDLGSIPGSGKSPGEGNGNPLQYSCLENPIDRGAWEATVHGLQEWDTTQWLKPPLRCLKVKCHLLF